MLEFWAVFPETKEVQVFRLQETEESVTFGAGERLESAVLPGLVIPLAGAFRE